MDLKNCANVRPHLRSVCGGDNNQAEQREKILKRLAEFRAQSFVFPNNFKAYMEVMRRVYSVLLYHALCRL